MMKWRDSLNSNSTKMMKSELVSMILSKTEKFPILVKSSKFWNINDNSFDT